MKKWIAFSAARMPCWSIGLPRIEGPARHLNLRVTYWFEINWHVWWWAAGVCFGLRELQAEPPRQQPMVIIADQFLELAKRRRPAEAPSEN